MKKLYFVFYLAFLITSGANAQLKYNFKPLNGNYIPLPNGIPVQLVTSSRPTVDSTHPVHDEGYYNNINIGFNFMFQGTAYSKISVNSNGFASFKPFVYLGVDTVYDYYTPNLTTGPLVPDSVKILPVLAPLWDDLDLFSDSSGITYEASGNVGSRILTIQWNKVYWDVNSGSSPNMEFQLKLYEGTNIIDFQYHRLDSKLSQIVSGVIGITDTVKGSFLSVNNTTPTATASSTFESFSQNSKPPEGQIYRFIPVTTYYSKPTGDLTVLSTWGSNPDGSGSAPSSFAEYDQKFILTNRTGNVDMSTASGTLDLGGELVLDSNIVLLASGKITVKSTANGTGRIGPVPANSDIMGNVTVERFIKSANNFAFRGIASSVNTLGSIFDNWQQAGGSTSGLGTYITGGPIANGFDATTPSNLLELMPNGQRSFVTDNTKVRKLDAKQGYALKIGSDRNIPINSGTNNTTLRATGSLLVGNVTYSGGALLLPNIKAITNPYASAIDWRQLINDTTSGIANNTTYSSSYAYIDPKANSTFVAVNDDGYKSIQTDPNGAAYAGVDIQSGQAFFLYSKNATTSSDITIKEKHKSSRNNILVFRALPTKTFASSIYFTSGGNRIQADGVNALYNVNYSSGVDGDDSPDFGSFNEDVSLVRNGVDLSIEARPIITGADTLFLKIQQMNQQAYEWQFAPNAFLNSENTAKLKDNFTSTLTAIDLESTTTYPFSVTAAPASSAPDRFQVIFGQVITLPVKLTSIKAIKVATGIQVEWNTANENNIDRYEVERSGNGQQFNKIGMITSKGNSVNGNSYNLLDAAPLNGVNYYRVRSIEKDGSAVYSSIVKVSISKGNQIVNIYPNPVKGKLISLELSNLEKGKYTISIVNNIGQKVYNGSIAHDGNYRIENINLDNSLSHGVYQLTITGSGKQITKQLIVQ